MSTPTTLTIRPVNAYSVVAYTAFTAVSLWGVLFLADLGPLPTIDDRQGPAWAAVVVDLALWLVFALQHSVMARGSFKTWLTRVVPQELERSTYVLAGGLALGLMFWQWRALPDSVWHVTAQPWVALIWAVYGAGWVTAIAATHMIDHWEFLGLKQADADADLSEQWLYRWTRHPMMLGLLVAFWVTPDMTAGHLLFALAGSAYVAVGVHYEERDLRRRFGPAYDDYSRRVGRFVPGL